MTSGFQLKVNCFINKDPESSKNLNACTLQTRQWQNQSSVRIQGCSCPLPKTMLLFMASAESEVRRGDRGGHDKRDILSRFFKTDCGKMFVQVNKNQCVQTRTPPQNQPFMEIDT